MEREGVSGDAAGRLRIVTVADARKEPRIGKLLCGGIEPRSSHCLAFV